MRRIPLKRRTPLKTKTPLRRGSTLRRGPGPKRQGTLRPVSAKRAKTRRRDVDSMGAYRASHPVCLLCGRQHDKLHHILFGQFGRHMAWWNYSMLCWDCEAAAHGVEATIIRARIIRAKIRLGEWDWPAAERLGFTRGRLLAARRKAS